MATASVTGACVAIDAALQAAGSGAFASRGGSAPATLPHFISAPDTPTPASAPVPTPTPAPASGPTPTPGTASIERASTIVVDKVVSIVDAARGARVASLAIGVAVALFLFILVRTTLFSRTK